MAKGRFSKDQILFALALLDSGMRVSKVCRQFGVSEAGLYRWRKKFGGLTAATNSRTSRSSRVA